ncbi:MAG TPA: hypothetical protein DCS93_29020 [Microscillaceae bacterium]|nr:hypothetical protein [Microscillaceae bacterium]
MKKILALVILSALVWACGGKKEATNTTKDSTITVNSDTTKNVQMTNHFGDDTLVKIYGFQNLRDSKSLLPYFTNTNPTYRVAAVTAFASVQDTTLIDTLASLLKDKDVKVRLAAVYALGQTGKKMKVRNQAEDALILAWEVEEDKQVKVKLLEAIGRAATPKGLRYLANLKIKDEDLLYGLAVGVFRAGQNRVFNDSLNSAMINLIDPGHQERVREMASHHLARFGRLAKGLEKSQTELVQAAASDQHPYVRMNCIRALANIKSPEVQKTLINSIKNDENYLVRINAMRTYRLSYDSVRTTMIETLSDKNEHVAINAAQYLLRNATATDADTLFQLAQKSPYWLVKFNLLSAAYKLSKDRDQIGDYIKATYDKSNNIYEQSYLLTALATQVGDYPWIADKLYNSDNKVLRTFAIDALSRIRRLPDFDKIKEDSVKKDFGDIFKYAIESKDVGLIYHAAQTLRNDKLEYKKFYRDRSFLQKTLEALKLPIDIEAYQELKRTIDYFNGKKKTDPFPTETKKDIDWKLVKGLPQSQKVQLKTSKGNIVFELFVNESPVSVATFVDLIKKGFYDGKTFHRVIANFVAQGGCPRGDGFGGLDYSITSEFAPLNYGTGYVGLASAGKDTESCQWFITHSPTPHLDGNYTIFAKVVEGMNVVHKIMIGDKIESVKLVEEAQ